MTMRVCPNCGTEGFLDGDENRSNWWEHNDGEPPVFIGPVPGSAVTRQDLPVKDSSVYYCPQCRGRFSREDFLPALLFDAHYSDG